MVLQMLHALRRLVEFKIVLFLLAGRVPKILASRGRIIAFARRGLRLIAMLSVSMALCAMCASRVLHLRLAHSSFWAQRDAHVDAGLHSMPAAIGLAVVCNCPRLRGRELVVSVQCRQRAWSGGDRAASSWRVERC